MLDQICDANPGWVAPIEWHTSASYPLYSAEARAKWFSYPPPYNGSYATPWLWVDGKSRGYNYNLWSSYITDQLLVASDVGLTHVGTSYDPSSRDGQVVVECYNSGADSVDAALQVVVTEDSLYYSGPNGDAWHNHVCRDYVPDQYGTPVTLAAGAYDTLTVPYSLNASWDEEKVKLVVYLQSTTMLPDSSIPCYQGAVANVLEFTGVEESELLAARDLRVEVGPNPCRTGCRFAVSGAAAQGARITIYSPDGRLVSSLETSDNQASWNRAGASRGVYLYRVKAGAATAEGKLVVTD